MDSNELYITKFNRELDRRNQLDNAINAPILGVTIVVTLNTYFIEKVGYNFFTGMTLIHLIIFYAIGLTIFLSLFFLFLSYNNLFKGFKYKNFGLLKDYRDFEKNLEEHNRNYPSESQKTFEQNIVDKIITFSDNHVEINDKRAVNLFRSKTCTILSLILTFIFTGIFAINSIIIMDDNNRPNTVPATPPQISRPEPPKMPVDRIEKGEDISPKNIR